jgi:GH18 family chitinase
MISEGVLVADPAVGEGVYIPGTGWQSKFDWVSVTPYLWNNVTGEFVTYDDPVSISYKREYAVQQGMQGMLVFDVEIDTSNGELMQYMN